MKTWLFILSMLSSSFATAEQLRGEAISQSVHILNERKEQTSCRLYRKRMETALQRSDEGAMAETVRKGNISKEQLRRLTDIFQRGHMPLEVDQENIVWITRLNMAPLVDVLSADSFLVQVDSPYFKWETDHAMYPDYFQVNLSPDKKTAYVVYKMTYMEACLAPLKMTIKISANADDSIEFNSVLNQSLL